MKQLDVAIGIVIRGGRILISRRRTQDSWGGYWEFPGGKQEQGETLVECLARELEEELGIRAHPIETLEVIQHDYPKVCVRIHPFICAHIEGEPKPLASERVAWVAPQELPSYRFPPANSSLIQYLMNRSYEVDP